MGQCLRPMISQDRETSRSRQNVSHAATSEERSAVSSKRKRGCCSTVALDEVLRRIECRNSFTPIESSFLPGLATSAHVEMSIFPSSQRFRVKEPTRAGTIWAHQLAHKNMGQAVTYQLWIRPFLGPNADSVIVYLLECDAVADFVVKGVEEDARLVSLIPPNIHNLHHFLSICIQMTFTPTSSETTQLDDASEDEGLNGQEEEQIDIASMGASTLSDESMENTYPPSLLFYAQQKVICHLDLARTAAAHTTPLPLHVQRDIFGREKFVTVEVSLWPRNAFIPAISVLVQEGMLVCEFVHLLRRKACIPQEQPVVLYHKFQMLHGCNEITNTCNQIDAFVPMLNTTHSNKMSVVLSLFGFRMSDITMDPAMKMKEFDTKVRQLMGLKEDSFLVFLPDGHYTPPYTTCSGWKCVHSFSVQPILRGGNSIRQSLRRRRSVSDRMYASADSVLLDRSNPQRRSLYAPRDGQAGSRRGLQTNPATPSDAVQQAESSALRMLANSDRHFPCKTRGDCEFDVPMYRVYHEMSMYQLTVEQYGISPGSIVQVYEVTGPAVPVSSRQQTDLGLSTSQGQRGNLMDVNPKWSLFTFAHYFDAMMSPSAVYLNKHISFGSHSVRVSECPDITLESLFEEWNPVWWNRQRLATKGLSRKDLLLNHFLSIQTVL